MKTVALALALGFVVGTAHAAETQIVDRGFVEAAMKRGAVVWDVRDAQDYAKGHIPGAVNVGDVGKTLRNQNTEDFLETAVIEKILGDAGIDPAKEVIAYGTTGNPYAHFAQYTIRYFGGKKSHVYQGGIDDWVAAGKPVSKEPAKPQPVKLSLKADESVFVTTAQVRGLVGKPDVQIIDARTSKEYSGDDIRALRGGHIPGSVNIPYEQNWRDPETPKKLAEKKATSRAGMELKDREALKALYAKLDPKKETVVYCQSGVRASHTAAVLNDLGFEKVKIYESSWLGYGNALDAPVENATFLNVGALNARMGSMQRRIEQLEAELAAVRQKKP